MTCPESHHSWNGRLVSRARFVCSCPLQLAASKEPFPIMILSGILSKCHSDKESKIAWGPWSITVVKSASQAWWTEIGQNKKHQVSRLITCNQTMFYFLAILFVYAYVYVCIICAHMCVCLYTWMHMCRQIRLLRNKTSPYYMWWSWYFF